jgi:hypothetical protein
MLLRSSVKQRGPEGGHRDPEKSNLEWDKDEVGEEKDWSAAFNKP